MGASSSREATPSPQLQALNNETFELFQALQRQQTHAKARLEEFAAGAFSPDYKLELGQQATYLENYLKGFPEVCKDIQLIFNDGLYQFGGNMNPNDTQTRKCIIIWSVYTFVLNMLTADPNIFAKLAKNTFTQESRNKLPELFKWLQDPIKNEVDIYYWLKNIDEASKWLTLEGEWLEKRQNAILELLGTTLSLKGKLDTRSANYKCRVALQNAIKTCDGSIKPEQKTSLEQIIVAIKSVNSD